jgi:hypothetical protein
LVAEVAGKRRAIDPQLAAGNTHDGLQLAREREAAAQTREEQRFLAPSITRKPEPSPALVDDREGKHTVEPRERVRPPLLECSEDDLCVRR